MPIGRIWEIAGAAAIPAIAVNNSKELERRLIGPINLFISKENPASHPNQYIACPPFASRLGDTLAANPARLRIANQSLSAAG
jgi:hypothetical protein